MSAETLPPKMPTLHENSLHKLNKTRRTYSIALAIIPISIYISIHYVLKYSPSYHLFRTSKFWFFVLNTLIIIIAADFGAFSNSSTHDDFYDEYVNKTRTRNVTSFELQYSKIVGEKKYAKQVDDHPQQKEVIKDVVVVNNVEIVVRRSEVDKKNDDFQENSADVLEVAPKGHDHVQQKTCHKREKDVRRVRSLSHKEFETKENEKKISLHRSNTENVKHDYCTNNGEENEFSSMSNEELNRRVEEFIQRFNRQIRLQAVARRLQEV